MGSIRLRTGGLRLAGSLDDVAIYGRALTGAEIAQHYARRTNAGTTGSGILTYSVAANPVSVARTATLTIAAHSVTVTQNGYSAPPTISVRLSPAPNSEGWNNTDVTASFTCDDPQSGVAQCPSPITFTAEGAGQTETVTATDVAGNQTTKTITVNIDRTGAAIAIDQSDPTTTDTSRAVTATVTDVLSGVVSAACNGTPALVADAVVHCTVNLRPGRNSIVVQASDRAGNSSSSSVRVTRTGTSSALAVYPSKRTLGVGQSIQLLAFDEFGQSVTGATWTSADSGIASMTGSTVTAVAPGNTTITAAVGGLSARLLLNVQLGSFAAGSVKWSVEPSAGSQAASVLYPVRTSSVAPHVFVVEATLEDFSGYVGTSVVAKALSSDGELLWVESAPLSDSDRVTQIAGDVNGGLLLNSFDLTTGLSSMTRFAGPDDAPTWRYGSSGGLSELTQSSDGSVRTFDGDILGLDGTTGRVQFRIPLPTSHRIDGAGNDFTFGPDWASPVTLGNGHSIFAVANYDEIALDGSPAVVSSSTLRVIDVGQDGAFSSTVIDRLENERIQYTVPRLIPEGVVPTDTGYALFYIKRPNVPPSSDYPFYKTVIRDGDGGSAYARASDWVPDLVGTGGIGYSARDRFQSFITNVRAYNIKTGAALWTSATSGLPVAAVDGGRVAVLSDGGDLNVLDATGSLLAGTTTSLSSPALWGGNLWHGVSAGEAIAITGPL